MSVSGDGSRRRWTRIPTGSLITVLVLAGGGGQAPADTRTSWDYAVTAETIDAGGGESSSGDYGLLGALPALDSVAGSSAAYGNQPGYLPQIVPAVVGQWVFYNRSAWDGNDPAANALDDAAIATDKTPLLPGGTGSYANYTSYHRGLNGLMVDLANRPEGSLGSADFVFKIGNDDRTDEWTVAPAPDSVVTRLGAGAGGADRVTLIWPDYAVRQQWVEVTVLANRSSGLLSPVVFYFGNAVGESGDHPGNALVNLTDEALARANPRSFLNPAGLDCPDDHNRDRRVNVTDEALARVYATTQLTALRLITPGAVGGTGGGGNPPAGMPGPLDEEREILQAPDLTRSAALDEWIGGRSVLGQVLSAEALAVEAIGGPGVILRLEASPGLAPGSWQPVPVLPTVDPVRRLWRWTVPIEPGAPARFHRLVRPAQAEF